MALIWALVSDHVGDNSQVLALAEELGLPFETKAVRYTWRKRLPGNNRRISLFSIDRPSREQLRPPWPDLLIMVGPRAQPIGRFVKRASGGRTKLVLIGRPRAPSEAFDLIFDTRQYLLPDAPHIRLLPVAMSRRRTRLEPTEEERNWLEALPRPHLLFMIGGPIRYWNLAPGHVSAAIAKLQARARRLGGSLVVTGSPRTPDKILARVKDEIAGSRNARLAERMPSFQLLMQEADELFPTADSISMISESVITGKPVGIVPVERTPWGSAILGPETRMRFSPFRDLRRFWSYLQHERLAGSIEEPLAADVENPVVAAATEVHKLLQAP